MQEVVTLPLGRAKVNKNSDSRQIFPSKNAGGGKNGFGRCAATAVRNDESRPRRAGFAWSFAVVGHYVGIGDIPSVAVFVALAALRFLCPPDRSHRRSAAELWRSAPPRPRPSPIRRDISRFRLSADGRAPRRRSPFPVRRAPPRRNPGRCRLSATATSCPT